MIRLRPSDTGPYVVLPNNVQSVSHRRLALATEYTVLCRCGNLMCEVVSDHLAVSAPDPKTLLTLVLTDMAKRCPCQQKVDLLVMQIACTTCGEMVDQPLSPPVYRRLQATLPWVSNVPPPDPELRTIRRKIAKECQYVATMNHYGRNSNGTNRLASKGPGVPNPGASKSSFDALHGAIQRAMLNALPTFGFPGERTSPRVDLPREKRDGLIRAKRVAHLVWDGKSITVRPAVHTKALLLPENHAVHWNDNEPSTEHEAPSENCVCGLYAQKSYGMPYENAGEYIGLDVELGGKVIEHELGYRAQYMRILAIEPSTKCACGADATILNGHKAGTLFFPACEEHAWSQHFSLVDIANATGIECRWWDGKAEPIGS